MTTDQLKNVILEAVDCLRLRKCRPDRESIAVYVMRKLGSSMNEIFSEIENTVDQGLLLKVEYKGSTSYRSPKNFDLKNSPLLTKHSKILNSSKTTRYVISGMNELLSSFPAYSLVGVPYEELKRKLHEFDKDRFCEDGIKVIFEREEAAGNIQVAQSDDSLDPVRIFPKDIKVPNEMKITKLSEDLNSLENKKKKRSKRVDLLYDNPGKKGKRALVFAVKSDPHKLAETRFEAEAAVKAKVEQISSIGMKVISEKCTTKKKGNKTNGKNKSSVDEDAKTCNKKPSLTLVKVEGKQELHGCADVQNPAVNERQATLDKFKSGKRKNKDLKVSPPSKQKKASVDTFHNDSDGSVIVTRKPPMYTYGAKKWKKDADYEHADTINEKSTSNKHGDWIEEMSDEYNGNLNGCAYCKLENGTICDSEDFLMCGTCNVKVHATCIAYSDDHAKRLSMHRDSKDLQWQCFTCKRCGVCQRALMASKTLSELKKTKVQFSNRDKQRYILCDHCDRGYHVKCVTDSLPLGESSWICDICSSDGVDPTTVDSGGIEGKNYAKNSKTLNVQSTKASIGKKKGSQFEGNSTENFSEVTNENGITASSTQTSLNPSFRKSHEEVPDISLWTPVQVQKYFTGKGLQDEAASLREQEIDGMSLLLLRRADVIFGLNLRLGPALKIYRLVCQLQHHSSALKKNGKAVN